MPKILVADDQPDLLDVIRTTLSLDGHEVFTVSDGESALRVAADNHPDLFILGVCMPVLGGLEVCASLLQAAVPSRILLISGMQETEAIRAALQAGGVDHLVKPFELGELKLRVERLLAEAVPPAAQ